MNAFARMFGFGRRKTQTRRFDAATGGRRWEGTPRFGSTGPETLAARAGRARPRPAAREQQSVRRERNRGD